MSASTSSVTSTPAPTTRGKEARENKGHPSLAFLDLPPGLPHGETFFVRIGNVFIEEKIPENGKIDKKALEEKYSDPVSVVSQDGWKAEKGDGVVLFSPEGLENDIHLQQSGLDPKTCTSHLKGKRLLIRSCCVASMREIEQANFAAFLALPFDIIISADDTDPAETTAPVSVKKFIAKSSGVVNDFYAWYGTYEPGYGDRRRHASHFVVAEESMQECFARAEIFFRDHPASHMEDKGRPRQWQGQAFVDKDKEGRRPWRGPWKQLLVSLAQYHPSIPLDPLHRVFEYFEGARICFGSEFNPVDMTPDLYRMLRRNGIFVWIESPVSLLKAFSRWPQMTSLLDTRSFELDTYEFKLSNGELDDRKFCIPHSNKEMTLAILARMKRGTTPVRLTGDWEVELPTEKIARDAGIVDPFEITASWVIPTDVVADFVWDAKAGQLILHNWKAPKDGKAAFRIHVLDIYRLTAILRAVGTVEDLQSVSIVCETFHLPAKADFKNPYMQSLLSEVRCRAHLVIHSLSSWDFEKSDTQDFDLFENRAAWLCFRLIVYDWSRRSDAETLKNTIFLMIEENLHFWGTDGRPVIAWVSADEVMRKAFEDSSFIQGRRKSLQERLERVRRKWELTQAKLGLSRSGVAAKDALNLVLSFLSDNPSRWRDGEVSANRGVVEWKDIKREEAKADRDREGKEAKRDAPPSQGRRRRRNRAFRKH